MSKPKKIRISLTMPEPLLTELDKVVEEGFYLSRGEIMLEASRHFLEYYYYLKSLMTPEPEATEQEEDDPEPES